VIQIKECVSLRKKEIVEEIKALRENYRIKTSVANIISDT